MDTIQTQKWKTLFQEIPNDKKFYEQLVIPDLNAEFFIDANTYTSNRLALIFSSIVPYLSTQQTMDFATQLRPLTTSLFHPFHNIFWQNLGTAQEDVIQTVYSHLPLQILENPSNPAFDIFSSIIQPYYQKKNKQHLLLPLIDRLDEGSVKKIVYTCNAFKVNTVIEHILETRLNSVSLPHLIREAVIEKNRPLAKKLLVQFPDSIPEAEHMILHDSYHKLHNYWYTMKSQHEQDLLKRAISGSETEKTRTTTRKI